MVIATKQNGSRERLSLDKYFNLIEHAADGIAILQDGVFKLVNTALARISGYDKEELLGMPFTNLLTPKSQKLTMARYQARLAGKEVPSIYEIKAVTKDGQVRDIEINAALTEYEGRVADEVIVRDITERKQAQEALRQSEEKLRTYLESAPDGVYINDLKGTFLYGNKKAEEIIGYSKEELIGKSFLKLNLLPAKYLAKAGKLLALNTMGKHTGPDDFELIKKDGTRTWVEINTAPIKQEGKTVVLGFVRDITERKQVEEALREAEEEKSALLEEAPIAILNVDLKGKITYVNKRFETESGYSREEIVGKNAFKLDWFSEGTLRYFMQRMAARLRGKPHKYWETQFKCKDGTWIWVTTEGKVIKKLGVPVGFQILASNITERKQAEEALRESQKFSSSLLESSPNPILVINLDTSVRYVNPAFEKLTGFTLAEITGRKAPYLWWPERKRKEITAAFKNAMAHGGRRTERNFQKKNGERFWVVVNSAPVVHDGKPLYFLINWLDITERKRAEEALRESEEKFSKAFRSSPDTIAITRLRDGLFLEVNDNFTRITGYTREEVINHTSTEINIWAKAEDRTRMVQILKEKDKVQNEEFEFRMKSGEIRVWLFSGEQIDIGGEPCIISMTIDITERKRMEQQLQEKNEQLDAQNEELKAINEELRATEQHLQEKNEQLDAQNEELKAINEELRATEEELQQSQEKLERMFESVTDGIIVANLDGTILKVNEKAAQMHGFASEDELLGKNAIELVAPHDHKRIASNMRKALKEGLIRSQEYTLLRADGSEFPGELSPSALKDASGKVIGHITIARDITESKQAEEKEKRLQQELNLTSRLASIGQLAAGVAHEINNPLTGVIGFSHLMMNRDIPNDMKQDLQVINSEAKRVAKIVENLLTFAHQRKPGREYVDINSIIARVLELRAYEMKVNNIEVETQLAPDLPHTMADAGQLQQVFLNIILNAEHFMTRAHNRGKLLVKTERIDGNIQASFIDDGPGISKENLDKVFNPFFTTKEVGSGTGLGLSICHGIIAQHKGRIYAQSELDQGATFVVELPIVDDATQAGQAEVTKEEHKKPKGAKILVVDDEPAILAFLHRLLTEWGHSVETINNAKAALDRLKTERYSLILLDIKLPGMSGVELYRRIEAIAPALTRRIMFITGDIMETATRDFLDKTQVPYITKPLNIELLKKTINHTLNQTHGAATTPG